LSALYAEEREIVRQLLPQGQCAEVDLIFDDAKRAILWQGKSYSFGQQKLVYRLVKMLWEGNSHGMEYGYVEDCLYGEENEYDFADRHRVCTLVCRTQKELAKADFPYQIETVKDESGHWISGWQLVYAQRTEKY
jgi:hypothetical protein